MKLKYQCPICGTPLGYEGLCWKCKSEQDRQSVMNWTAEQIKEKQELLISNIQRLADMEDPEFTIFWQLLSYQNAITPEIQSKALTAEIYNPCEIYYHAPENVRDGLIFLSDTRKQAAFHFTDKQGRSDCKRSGGHRRNDALLCRNKGNHGGEPQDKAQDGSGRRSCKAARSGRAVQKEFVRFAGQDTQGLPRGNQEAGAFD